VWRKGKPHPDAVTADIARAAQLTVEEGDRHSPSPCHGARGTPPWMAFPAPPSSSQAAFAGRVEGSASQMKRPS
jgi:hypothetical protein